MASIGNMLSHLQFVRKKPLVLFRILNGYFKTLILRKKTLRTIDWGITYKCNFNCTYCSAKILMRSNKDKKELTPEQIKEVWNEAKKLGVIHVNLTGGEPTLKSVDELCRIIRNFEPNKFLISLVTNGSLLNEEKIKKLKEAGLDTLQLSVDSSYPEIHDRLRNKKGNFSQLMQCLRWAKKNGLNVCVSTILTRDNFDDVKKLADLTKREKAFLLLNPIAASGACQGKEEKKLKEMDKKRYYDLLKIGHVRTDTILNFRGGSGCPGGVERIEITAYGDVMTCPLVQISYGNVLEEPLTNIYKRISNFPLLKDFVKDCRHVFNDEYIQKMIRPIDNVKNLPISIFDHPISKDKEVQQYLEKTKK